MLEGDVAQRRRRLARTAYRRRLEAEQERWFLWLPVLLGLGIAVLLLACRPSRHLPTALAPLAAMLALAVAAPPVARA